MKGRMIPGCLHGGGEDDGEHGREGRPKMAEASNRQPLNGHPLSPSPDRCPLTGCGSLEDVHSPWERAE